MIIRKEPDYLLVRKLEREKERPVKESGGGGGEDSPGHKILEMIKTSEDTQGIEVEKLIVDLSMISAEIINQEVQKMLEQGIIYEPRPGKVRYLG